MSDSLKTICSICLHNCGIDAEVANGRLRKIAGSPEGRNRGYLCCKAYASREYVYRADRLKTPLKRVGKRGEGRFEPISWDAAYALIAERLNGYKAEFGPDSVAFYSGYSKWYRTLLHRLTYAFGSINYGTESSACFQATRLADILNAGSLSRADIAHTDLFLAWAFNPFYSSVYQHEALAERQRQGLKIICIDPRVTPFAQLSDLHLQLKAGTDGALAHYLAAELIRAGAVDKAYIARHIQGYDTYSEYVQKFTLEVTAAETGLAPDKLKAAAALLTAAPTFAIHEGTAPVTHHCNGVQNHRALMALSAISGNYDRQGGNLPTEYAAENLNFPKLLDDEFINAVKPANHQSKIGGARFPVWSALIEEFQAMDLARQILEAKPYPIKALFALGLNYRMFPGHADLRRALEQIDFFVDVDLFMTDSAKYADIVLPACSSFERSQFQSAFLGSALCWPTVQYVAPVIEPLGEARSDADIICELARYIAPGDEHLAQGYEHCCRQLLQGTGVTLEELQNHHQPQLIKAKPLYKAGSNTAHGYKTPSGKFELYSEMLAQYGYEPLPIYHPPAEDASGNYPLRLTAGGRLPFEFHSRFQNMRFTEDFRPGPMLDLNPADAAEFGIQRHDDIFLETARGRIRIKANPTHMVAPGSVFMYQDYATADVNEILDGLNLDPISGFPAYRSVPCRVVKAG